jgi:hypothetical protein
MNALVLLSALHTQFQFWKKFFFVAIRPLEFRDLPHGRAYCLGLEVVNGPARKVGICNRP